MCGIAGYWFPNDTRVSSPNEVSRDGGALQRMLDCLTHRGPDDRGVKRLAEVGLAMGHTRLSIVGLDHGHQPIVSNDGRITATVNGEFYGYKKIRAELACQGYQCTIKSDSAIAVPLYQRDGMAFVDQLRGEFAFAMFDAERERLILVRDRFGIKPLYYSMTSDGIVWGSEVKAILQHPAVPVRLCRRAALHQMMQVMVPGTTSFEGVQAVLPGHLLIITRQGGRLQVEDRCWWDLDFPTSHPEGADPAPYVEGVRQRLIDAVATRLEADVPVGCYLSGGIDSCSILGLATSLQQSPIKAFTIAFDHTDYDESAIAKRMAQRTGAEQELLRLSEKQLYGPAFERATWHAERTFYNTLAVAKWHMSRRVRQCAYKAVITGEGSDELFGGYPFFKRDYLGVDGEAGVFAGAILSEEMLTHEAWQDLCGFTPSWIQPWMLTLRRVYPLLSEELRETLDGYDPVAEIANKISPDRVRDRHRLDISQYTWCKTMLEGQILTWGGDRMDMANSMEARPAFLDHHVAEYAVQIPPDMRIRNGIEKWVLREAMVEVLPRELYEREKFAFMAPPAHTDVEKRGAVEKLAARWLTPERIEAAGLFDRAKVDELMTAAWQETDSTVARRNDILINHLLQLHILDGQFANGEAPPELDDAAVVV
ncbi:asparagine synthase (glutamine-hydrolyzing) [Planctomycetaceae bacterium SH139]